MPAYVRLGPGAAEAGPPPAGAAPPPPPPISPPQRPFPSHVACRRRRAAVPRGRGGALAVESVRQRAAGARGAGAVGRGAVGVSLGPDSRLATWHGGAPR